MSKQAGGYPYEYVDYNQPPSVNHYCPIGLFGKGDRSWLSIPPPRPRHTERRLHPREPLFHWRRAMHGKRHMREWASLRKQELRKLPWKQQLRRQLLLRPLSSRYIFEISPIILYFNSYHPSGEGDQFVFDTRTVLGKQMELTLNWLDDAEEPTTISCCTKDGPKERQCGGPGGESCRTICGAGTLHLKTPLCYQFKL